MFRFLSLHILSFNKVPTTANIEMAEKTADKTAESTTGMALARVHSQELAITSDLGPQSIEQLPGNAIESFDGSALPPVDRGKDAWLFLAAAFVVEILIFGKFSEPSCSIACHTHQNIQDSVSRSVFFKTTTAPLNRSRVPQVLRSLVF